MDFSITHQRNRERSEKTSLKECETTRFISAEVEIIDNIIWMCAVNYPSLTILFIMYQNLKNKVPKHKFFGNYLCHTVSICHFLYIGLIFLIA